MASNHALLEVQGTSYQLNEEGRLQDNGVWTEEIAVALAAGDGMTLIEDHWIVINLLREFYKEFNHTPAMKLFLKEIAHKLDNKFSDQAYLNQLFPEGILIQSSRIAGVPSPHRASLINDTQSIVTANNKLPQNKPSNDQYEKFEFDGEIYRLTIEGNLVEHYSWSEKMAEYFAQKEGLELTDDHWVIIRFMRGFYEEYLVSPMVKLLIKHMRESLGEEKSNKKYLYELFPDGPSKQGSRIAGLPHPIGCID